MNVSFNGSPNVVVLLLIVLLVVVIVLALTRRPAGAPAYTLGHLLLVFALVCFILAALGVGLAPWVPVGLACWVGSALVG